MTLKSEATFWLSGPKPESLADRLHGLAKLAESEAIPADVYGRSSWFQETEQRFADYFGQEAAIFLPTGAMAQQLAMRYHCERRHSNCFAMHPTCQLELNEHHAYSILHGLEASIVGRHDKILLAEDLECMDSAISALIIELPMRQLGGQAPDKEQLTRLIDAARRVCPAVHLDAARAIEVCPFYETTPNQLGSRFDSVYLSCYKGLGGMGGAILAGTREMVDWMLPWRRRNGGEIKLMTPYLLNAAFNLEGHLENADCWWRRAKVVASLLNAIDGVSTRPIVPRSFLFHIEFSFDEKVVLLARDFVLKKTGVWLFDYAFRPRPDQAVMTEVALQAPADDINDEFLARCIEVFGASLLKLSRTALHH